MPQSLDDEWQDIALRRDARYCQSASQRRATAIVIEHQRSNTTDSGLDKAVRRGQFAISRTAVNCRVLGTLMLAIALLASSVPASVAVHGSPATLIGALDLGGVRIISRDQWGAGDGEGSPRWVPMFQRPFHIVIHHTAAETGPNGSIGDITTIWAYHTFTLGWGDIGYNYLIDPEGNVYEGRAGGDSVVGAHTQHFNFGSIGISLMGDYSVSKPAKAMMASLRELVTMLSNRYGIDARATFSEDGASYPEVGGHRDFNYTECPGINVYDLLPVLRQQVASGVRSDAAPGEGETVFVHSGAPAMAQLVVRNTGTTTWNGRFTLRLTAGDEYRALMLPIAYSVPDVGPGGTITIPLFLPALRAGQVINTDWQLSDMTGNSVGQTFPFSIVALAPGSVLPTPFPAPTLTFTPIPTTTPTNTITSTPTPSNTVTRTPRPTGTRPTATRRR